MFDLWFEMNTLLLLLVLVLMLVHSHVVKLNPHNPKKCMHD